MYEDGLSSGAAIHVTNSAGSMAGGQNVRLFRVILIDCPQAVYFENSLQCSMLTNVPYTTL